MWSRVVIKAVRLAFVLLFLATASFGISLSVSSPTGGTTTTSPVHFVASASSGYKVSSYMIYVDNKAVYTGYSTTLDTYVSMTTGSHSIAVKSWDSSGALAAKTFSLTVGTAATGGGNQTSGYLDVDQMTGWQACTACAGVVGVDDAPNSFTQNQASPSMDGKSMKFWIGGTTPYRNALWYIGFGPQTARHYIFDTYFYITNPNAAMALEFDMNQYINGKKYIFAHQCSVQWSHTWDTWNPVTGHWETTGIACPVFQAYKWNHVQLEVERTTDGQMRYVAITYNGVKNYVNRYRAPGTSSWNGFSIDYQMDGDKYQTDYSTWLDKLNINKW